MFNSLLAHDQAHRWDNEFRGHVSLQDEPGSDPRQEKLGKYM